jgi:hypothetical protein
MKWTRETWRQVPAVRARTAVEADFEQRIAVFWQDSPDSRPIDIELPHPAIVTLPSGDRVPAVIVQAERLPDARTRGTFDMFGAYAPDGASMMCGPGECDLVDETDREWLKLMGYR